MDKVMNKGEKYLRKHKQSIMLNDMEFAALNQYCKKYRVKNRSKFMREAIVSLILKKFDEDYPRLFDVPEVARKVV